MSDVFSTNRNLIIKRHKHAKYVALANILLREIRMSELDEEIERNKKDIIVQNKSLNENIEFIKQHKELENTPARNLTIKRYEHGKMVAIASIEAREIKIIELEEEIERNKQDIIAQNKIIEISENNINQQLEELKTKEC